VYQSPAADFHIPGQSQWQTNGNGRARLGLSRKTSIVGPTILSANTGNVRAAEPHKSNHPVKGWKWDAELGFLRLVCGCQTGGLRLDESGSANCLLFLSSRWVDIGHTGSLDPARYRRRVTDIREFPVV
jgi:hypothetical protein